MVLAVVNRTPSFRTLPATTSVDRRPWALGGFLENGVLLVKLDGSSVANVTG